MKKVFFAVLSAVVIGFSSCEKIKSAAFPDFEHNVVDIRITVPATSDTASEKLLGSAVTNLDIDSLIGEYSENQFKISNANSIKISRVQLAVANPDASNNLSNLEYAKVKFYTNTNTTPVEIATGTIANEFAVSKEIALASPQPELKGYLGGNQIVYSVSTNLRKAVTRELNLSLTVTFDIQ